MESIGKLFISKAIAYLDCVNFYIPQPLLMTMKQSLLIINPKVHSVHIAAAMK